MLIFLWICLQNKNAISALGSCCPQSLRYRHVFESKVIHLVFLKAICTRYIRKERIDGSFALPCDFQGAIVIRLCFNQLNAHILERLLCCWRSKMCALSFNKASYSTDSLKKIKIIRFLIYLRFWLTKKNKIFLVPSSNKNLQSSFYMKCIKAEFQKVVKVS